MTYNDEGFYICKAGNTLGETTAVATLEIAGNYSRKLIKLTIEIQFTSRGS